MDVSIIPVISRGSTNLNREWLDYQIEKQRKYLDDMGFTSQVTEDILDAEGKFIAYVHDDCWYAPQRIHQQMMMMDYVFKRRGYTAVIMTEVCKYDLVKNITFIEDDPISTLCKTELRETNKNYILVDNNQTFVIQFVKNSNIEEDSILSNNIPQGIPFTSKELSLISLIRNECQSSEKTSYRCEV